MALQKRPDYMNERRVEVAHSVVQNAPMPAFKGIYLAACMRGLVLLAKDEGYLSVLEAEKEPTCLAVLAREHKDIAVAMRASNLQGAGVHNPSTQERVPETTWTPGLLCQLFQACHQIACCVAATGLFIVVYDNINLMFRVVEQILGKHSE